jgi:23S rRNA (uracil1939-C5)-methyltransferase
MDISGASIVDIKRCEIVDETINEQISALRNEKTFLPRRDAECVLWSRGAFAGKGNSELILREAKGKNFYVPPEGFFQANLCLTEKLVDEVCRLAVARPVHALIDAYCGSGLFSVFLSSYVKNIFGIESHPASVACARMNAAAAGADNVKFYEGKVEDVLAEVFCRQKKKPDVVLLDPPRIGCSASVLRLLARLLPLYIIYISCNPATQARDVRFLRGQGYRLSSLVPLDMFPQTQHIEVIGVLETTGEK